MNWNPVAPRIFKPRQVQQMLNCGNTTFYKLVAEKRLDLVKDGKSSFVTAESVERYLASLKPAQANEAA
ncbi:hypothetical protein CK489_28835 [Bradyrhizobium sp. UFLA03-84]|uniref:helix-turn-helix domain-containing protein n=1 Tax=Bradyrhizobium sp. UFLA03-84 TaxID=418599 RepID=UPI000BAE52CA|nr:helix-turn-helix domain-containing protein [Bradyrhizobium sp. UFLA03-84]PAY05399.1 hypothetical protein CK489_28835 [Bradyrhizobium sp. UFLA03-84]